MLEVTIAGTGIFLKKSRNNIEPRAELPSCMKENYHFGEI